MADKIIQMDKMKKIALIAHDNKKKDLIEWVKFNKKSLANHKLFGTGTTGKMIEDKIDQPVHKFKSGPVGGDVQVSTGIVEDKIDVLIFFWDPLEPLPHDPDVKALLRIAVVYNVPVACNRASADFIFSSPLMNDVYDRHIKE